MKGGIELAIDGLNLIKRLSGLIRFVCFYELKGEKVKMRKAGDSPSTSSY
jgi:hypothetical protein